MATSRREIETEISLKVAKTLEVRRGTEEFAEDVKRRVIEMWEMQGPHPYETGDFVASIHTEKKRDRAGHWPHWAVTTRDEKAHFIEYGTGIDAEGTHSPYGRFTPTRAYAPFAKAAASYGGTSP